MQLLPFLYPALVSLLLLDPVSSLGKNNAKSPKDAILLSKVKTLTLRANKKTSHRRVAAIPQLSCQGPGCAYHKVEIMRCTNQGSDYEAEDVQWSCTVDLPDEFKLGSTEVICEGYDNAADERILKGSCGVEYRLLLTEKGEERYGTTWWGGSKSKSKGKGSVSQEGEEWTWSSALFTVLFIGVAVLILVAACSGERARREPRPLGGGRGGWGGGGGGGGGGWDDPPPPYPGKRYNSSTQEGWRPGFWSGAATGAAAGYMAGNRGNRREPPAVQSNRGWFGRGGDNGSGSWGTNPSRSSGSESRSSGSGSIARHESTGFGSTSRR